MKNSLRVSEHFMSLQGEGPTTGRPAVFLRLGGCVLSCRWCDTAEVWKKSTPMSFEALRDVFTDKGYLDNMRRGARLVLTGGDPLMQESSLYEFCDYFDQSVLNLCGPDSTSIWHLTEIETEGVLTPKVFSGSTQYNVSPKLANSGMPEHRRVKPATMEWHADCAQRGMPTSFKFVVSDHTEMDELLKTYIIPFEIPGRSVWLMPLADTAAKLTQVGPRVAELAKSFGYNYCNRLHLQLWDKSTGV